MTFGKTVAAAARQVLSNPKYSWLFALSSAFFAGLYLIYPVLATPGNDLGFQLSITPWWGLALIALLAFATGLLVAMQAYIFRRLKAVPVAETGGTVLGGVSAFLANMFASASCTACVSALFSFLGLGTILFLMNYRWEIVGASIALIFVALYFASKRIQDNCLECGAPTAIATNKGKGT